MKVIQVTVKQVETKDAKEIVSSYDSWTLKVKTDVETTALNVKEFASAEVLGWAQYKGIQKVREELYKVGKGAKDSLLADEAKIEELRFLEYVIYVTFAKEEVPVRTPRAPKAPAAE